jgi:hypothetical protein
MALVRTSWAIRRSNSIESKLERIVYYTSGLIPAILIRVLIPNSCNLWSKPFLKPTPYYNNRRRYIADSETGYRRLSLIK